jgi:sugar porter (SP) family MFS transporter
LLFWSITVALGGFLFGLDTAVISGAEQSIQKLWRLDDFTHGLAVAMALYGTVFGAMFGGIPADRIGRKSTLFWVGILYLISALGASLAPEVNSFMFFRFIGGLGVGASSVAAPMYISEIAPANRRGRLVAMFQFNIVLGILIAYLSNYLLRGVGDSDWRLMIGIVAIPAFIFTILVLRVPQSPRWLVIKGRTAEALDVLKQIDPATAEADLKSMVDSHEKASGRGQEPFFSKKYRFPIILAFLFAFFNQVSGINAIIYYAPRIFEMAGLGKDASLLQTAGIGLINLISTMLGLSLIDRYGRRILMLVGSLGLILTLGLVANAFYSNSFGGVPIYLFGFIAFFAFSQGAVIWVFISEIFPNEVRGAGQSLGSFTHWIMAAVIANAFPWVAGKFGGGPVFLFFTVMMTAQLAYTWFLMPETKGVSLEEMEANLAKSNPGRKP